MVNFYSVSYLLSMIYFFLCSSIVIILTLTSSLYLSLSNSSQCLFFLSYSAYRSCCFFLSSAIYQLLRNSALRCSSIIIFCCLTISIYLAFSAACLSFSNLSYSLLISNYCLYSSAYLSFSVNCALYICKSSSSLFLTSWIFLSFSNLFYSVSYYFSLC